jgi:hypothetical protein
VFAFLSASSLARNSDLWFHLAAGRLLANGKFSFGKDPFAFTTEQVYWANHSWLFDLALYGLRNGIGDTGVVVLKALLVTALAGILLSVRRRDQSLLVPAFCTTLALLAMNPRLLLQPTCVSFFLMGLTFWILWRQKAAGLSAQAGRLSKLLLLTLFVLWVNVDEWFLLGPVLATLFWFGERLQPAGGFGEAQQRMPGWLVLAGWVACLLSPYTYRGFTLPTELSPVTWSSGLHDDARFRYLFASPWQVEYWRAAAEWNGAGLAYYVLTILGLLSFLLKRRGLLGWRLIIWLPFAGLAAWQAHTIPFFAVVAAPILTLNLQEYLARSTPEQLVPAKTSFHLTDLAARLYPFLLSCSLLALILLSWPGRLAGCAGFERHVAWGIQPDASLKRAAEMLHQWRRQGLLSGSEHVFALHPEIAHYCAWFCPEEKQFFDHRYPLFVESAREYEMVCRALLEPRQQGGNGDWRHVLRERGISVVILSDREPKRMLALLNRLGSDRAEWTLLDVSGSVLIFGWNSGRPAGGFAPLAFDAARLAFGQQDEKAYSELPTAPEQGPGMLPDRRTLDQQLTRLPAQPSWESPAATTFLNYFHQRQVQDSLSSLAAGLSGGSPLPTATALIPQIVMTEHSSELLLLTVRAARRAVAINPEDSNAWLRLGQAYSLLCRATCEHSAQGMLPLLARLRQLQSITALQQALRLDPELEEAHHDLADLYRERKYLDMELEHRRQERQISERAGWRPGETAEEYADRLKLLTRDIANSEKTLHERRNNYTSGSRALVGEGVQKARLALNLGLTREAMDEILSIPGERLGVIGIKMELELLLELGRTEEARARLNEKDLIAFKRNLGFDDIPSPANAAGTPLYPVPYRLPLYDWLRALQTAAVGDYARAEESLRTIHGGLAAAHDLTIQRLRALKKRDEVMIGGMFSGPLIYLPAAIAGMIDQDDHERTDLQTGEGVVRAQQADLLVLVGMLALEQGATGKARSVFTTALKLCEQPSGAAVPFAGEPIVSCYLGNLNRQER